MPVFNAHVFGNPVMPVTFTYEANGSSDASSTSFTFSSLALGTAAADRKIVIAVTGEGTNINSLTVAGNSATEVVTVTSSTRRQSIYQVDVPTGATGNVVVTWSTTSTGCSVAVYAVYGAASSAHDTATDNAISGTQYAATIDIPANGACFGGCNVLGSSGATMSWGNLTEYVDDPYSTANPSFDRMHGSAADDFVAEQTALSVTCNVSSYYTEGAGLCLASWGPA